MTDTDQLTAQLANANQDRKDALDEAEARDEDCGSYQLEVNRLRRIVAKRTKLFRAVVRKKALGDDAICMLSEAVQLLDHAQVPNMAGDKALSLADRIRLMVVSHVRLAQSFQALSAKVAKAGSIVGPDGRPLA